MRTAATPFTGFPVEAFAFLAGLARNNSRGWFEAHRAEYEEAIVAPALAFVESMGAALRRIAPTVVAEPRIGGSLFRIHRDVRFSSDKRPYKTHVGIRLRDGDTATSSKCTGPIFYIEFDAKRLRLGVGVKEFGASMLQAYRTAVCRPDTARDIGDTLRRAESRGHEILGEMLGRIPPSHAREQDNDLLRRKGLFITEEMPLPKAIHGPGFLSHCTRWFEPYAPLFKRLREIAREGSR